MKNRIPLTIKLKKRRIFSISQEYQNYQNYFNKIKKCREQIKYNVNDIDGSIRLNTNITIDGEFENNKIKCISSLYNARICHLSVYDLTSRVFVNYRR